MTTKNLIATIITIAAIGILGFLYYTTHTELTETKETLLSTQANVENLQDTLAQKNTQISALNDALQDEQDRNDNFQSQIRRITNTVGTLEKLRTLDPELLKKYSKVYFLNENYNPVKLSQIDPKYTVNKNEMYIHTEVLPFLKKMLDAANRANIKLQVVSGYRSFDTQVDVKSGYKTIYGSGANQFSADQGYSEHQLGTAVDLNSPALGSTLEISYENDPSFKWLQENAYKYGFILSYPKGNAYYQYEPWHWRFVGTTLAEDIHETKKNFYDMDQRDIDAYLITIFD